MREFMNSKRLLALMVTLGTCAAAASGAAPATSEWVHPGPDGKLVYQTTPAGDRILDFSYAGYMGGGVKLPDVPVRKTVQPSGGADDTAAIQAAIDEVAAMSLRGAFRGAVLLAPGTFTCAGSITIPTSGIVLRGSGSGADGTTLKMVGPKHEAILIGGGGKGNASGAEGEAPAAQDSPPKAEFSAAKTSITDAYVPAGASTFTVADAGGFAAGDAIVLTRPTTAAWVKLMGMDDLKRDGKPQTWIPKTRSGMTRRTIAAIEGNKITIDIPLADSYDAKYLNPPGTTVAKVKPAAMVTQVGVEHLHIQCPQLEVSYLQAPYSAIRVGGDDCWVRDVYCEETMNSTTLAGRRITIEGVVVKHTYPNLGASKPSDFSIEGSQILIDRCSDTGGNTYWVWTTSLNAGPNVVLNSTFTGRGSRIQPHMRWSTGLLVDNCRAPDGGIDFMNRGVAGSGHGWTMGWAVAWNCVAKTYVIQNPPGAANWAIGCIGTRVRTARLFDKEPILPEGNFDSYGTPVAPRSLYLAQLVERLGPTVLSNIGYAANDAPALGGDDAPEPSPEQKGSVDPVLGEDLAFHRPVNTNSVRGAAAEFGGEKALDGDDTTYWAPKEGVLPATLEVDMEGPVEINALEIGEATGLGDRVKEYKVEGQVDSDWKLLSQGTTIGERKVDRFPKTTVWKVRLSILKARDYPGIRKFSLYLDKGNGEAK